MSIGDVGAADDQYFSMQVHWDTLTDLRYQVQAGGTTAAFNATVTISPNTWHHGCAIFAATNDHRIFLDGANKNTSATTVSPSSFTKTLIGAEARSGAISHYFDGSIAEAAVWNVALSDDEVASLAKGFSPTLVRPDALVGYWPLFGNDSPEPDRWKSRFDMTVTGATKADHVRMFAPTRAKVVKGSETWTTSLAGSITPAGTLTIVRIFLLSVIGAITPSGSLVRQAQKAVSGALTPAGALVKRLARAFAGALTSSGSATVVNPTAAVITVNGVDRTTSIRKLTTPLRIGDELDEAPNFGDFRCTGFTPVVGEEVIIGRGAISEREFAGHIIGVTQIYEGLRANVAYDVRMQDYTWTLNKRLVNATYTNQSATAIITDLIATYASDFTVANVHAGLPTIDDIQFTDVPLPQALTRVVRRAGAYWYPDYTKDVHAFTADAANAPDPLNDANLEFRDLTVERDITQLRTRVFCEGGGSQAPLEIPVGTTILPVEDASWYAAAGGTGKSGTQRVTYTGKDAGGTGALVGAFVLPTNAPTVARRIGTGLAAGDYYWAATFFDGTGETTPGPNSAIVTLGGTVTAPSAAPSAAKRFGGLLSAGAYQYKVTFVDSAGGETTPGPASPSVTLDGVTAPGAALTAADGGAGNLNHDGYRWVVTFVADDGGGNTGETVVGPLSDPIALANRQASLGSIPFSGQPGVTVTKRKLYRNSAAGPDTFKLAATINDNTTTTHTDNVADGSLGAQAPGSSTADYRKIQVTSIPTSPDANVTARKIYRTVAGGSIFKLVATVNNNTTTSYLDNIADASLGADAPAANTAVYKQASLTTIPLGPTGTTGRKLYRVVAGGSQLKLLATISDNSTTTYTDTTADASLGANAPTSNTSALADPSASVNAGSTSIPVTSVAPFLAGGGWATIGSQYIRYTGTTSTAVTGVPASGTGALLSTVKYGVSILAAPILTGVPASGAGSVLYAIKQGDVINVLAQKDDAAAQATYGVIEHLIQDQRLSLASAATRAQADLDLFKAPIVTIRYKTRDVKTKTGKTVTVDLGAPTNVSGTFKVQRVQIEDFERAPGTLPLRVVDASSIKFSFEDLVRRLEAAAA